MTESQTKRQSSDVNKNNNDQKQKTKSAKTENTATVSSFGLNRLYSRVDIGGDKWLLSQDHLSHPPSLSDGLDRLTEQELRYLGCELIQTGAILLRLPQVAAATAQILYQRYFYQKSFVKFNFEHTSMACLLLASKIEEAPRRPRDVINVFHRLKQLYRSKSRPIKKWQPMILDKNYILLKNNVIKAERRVLSVLGFVVHIKHPHKLICSYVHALNCSNYVDLVQKAWSYMNDGLRTDIFLRYSSETIACACIFLAARTIKRGVALPSDPFDWFELFDASDRDVNDIALVLTRLYTRVKTPNWLRLEAKVAETREKLPGYNAANRVSKFGQTEDTEKSTADRIRFGTPVKDGEDSRQVNGKVENKRRRSRSRSPSYTSPPPHYKPVPKRYKSPGTRANREHRHRDKRLEKRKDRVMVGSPGGRKRRSSSRPRVRSKKEERRAREKEVMFALGKRRRDSSSPEILRSTSNKKR